MINQKKIGHSNTQMILNEIGPHIYKLVLSCATHAPSTYISK